MANETRWPFADEHSQPDVVPDASSLDAGPDSKDESQQLQHLVLPDHSPGQTPDPAARAIREAASNVTLWPAYQASPGPDSRALSARTSGTTLRTVPQGAVDDVQTSGDAAAPAVPALASPAPALVQMPEPSPASTTAAGAAPPESGRTGSRARWLPRIFGGSPPKEPPPGDGEKPKHHNPFAVKAETKTKLRDFWVSFLCPLRVVARLTPLLLQRIFSYSTWSDRLLIALASLASICTGVTMPLMNVVFGEFVFLSFVVFAVWSDTDSQAASLHRSRTAAPATPG